MECKVVCVVGTRPEAIKMAPVVLRLRRPESGFRVRVLATGQHADLLATALADFGLTAELNLELMRPDQDLAGLTARGLVALDRAFAAERPDLVLAQGDTTSVVCTALACYYRQIPLAHVEAGLRTGLPYAPFPEEKNRVLATHLAVLHFAPTPLARANLLKEGIAPGSIHVTGNTVIDALKTMAERQPALPVRPPTARFLLVTAHRREHFGGPLEEICAGLLALVDGCNDLSVVYPVHPNPNVRDRVHERLGHHPRILLIEPVAYPAFVALMRAAFAILTDSGGVQEEAPALGKPVLVLREATERPEAVAAGTVQVVGPRREAIVSAVEELCGHPAAYDRFARAVNPYGDGHAADRIARVLARRFGLAPGPLPPGVEEEWVPPGLC